MRKPKKNAIIEPNKYNLILQTNKYIIPKSGKKIQIPPNTNHRRNCLNLINDDDRKLFRVTRLFIGTDIETNDNYLFR
ncbi:hypothetical protein DERF_009987 [Dermatophagoides farinae]|uniref:Uncharacterized protein n=1 Tax=Dermatophagoides farinae TaxID=6954 RepID=A0A922HV05_DERFA|nr:hypothetical protein DERF_009987 [Dermatophagoides farinae]